jgi:hypothetical protein
MKGVAYSWERCLEGWRWLDTDRHRYVAGLDLVTGSAVVAGPIVLFEIGADAGSGAPPRWVATRSGVRILLGAPARSALPADDEAADLLLDAIDMLRATTPLGVAGAEACLTPWRPDAAVSDRQTA